jgi:nucleotide-binding universal stress UspA family protein
VIYINQEIPDKASPFARRERKAMDQGRRSAKLAKNEFAVNGVFFWVEGNASISPCSRRCMVDRLPASASSKEATMHQLKHILVVSRMTRHGKPAVHYAIYLSKKCGATLYVLHVMNNPFNCGRGWNLSAPTLRLPDEYEKRLQKTKEELDAVVDTKRWKDVHIIKLIRTGDPGKVIMRVAEEEDIDLIIMPAHEDWPLEKFLSDDGSDKIMRRLPCSVLLVKTDSGMLGAEY